MRRASLLLLAVLALNACKSDAKKEDAKPVTPVNNNIVVAIGKVEPEKKITELSAPASGIVVAVLKTEADSVKQGEVLVQLDETTDRQKLNEFKAQIQSQETQVRVDVSRLKEFTVQLSNKRTQLEKLKRLVSTGAETQQSVDDLQTQIGVLESNLQEATAKVQLAKDRIREINAQLQTAQTELLKKQFHAPYDGVLLDMQLKKGEAATQYQTYATLAPAGNLMVRAEVDELFSAKVKTGQPVDVSFVGSEAVVAHGTVSLVGAFLRKKSLFSDKANDQEDRRVLEVQIALQQPVQLIINAKVECKIKL